MGFWDKLKGLGGKNPERAEQKPAQQPDPNPGLTRAINGVVSTLEARARREESKVVRIDLRTHTAENIGSKQSGISEGTRLRKIARQVEQGEYNEALKFLREEAEQLQINLEQAEELEQRDKEKNIDKITNFPARLEELAREKIKAIESGDNRRFEQIEGEREELNFALNRAQGELAADRQSIIELENRLMATHNQIEQLSSSW